MARQKNADKKKIEGVRLPSRPLYSFAMGCLRPVIKLAYNVRLCKVGMEGIKPPYIVLANHCSRLDWIYVAMAVRPTQLNAVITRYFYSNPTLRYWLDKVGAIGKDQFTPDVAAVKNMIKATRMGGSIMLFPEGRTSPIGVSETFERSTVKLLRHLKVPTVAVKMEGSFFSMPKWNAGKRRGRVDLTVTPLFLPEEYDSLTDDEMFARMCRVLATDDFAWQKKNRVRFRGRHFAKGLDGVLYMCPKCRSELTMVSDDHTIRCSKCGNGASIDRYYDIKPLDEQSVIPENMAQWYREQVEYAKSRIEEDGALELCSRVRVLQSTEKKWLQEVGEGEAVMNSEGFTYKGTRGGEPYELFIPIAASPAISYNPNNSFDMYYGGEEFTFLTENPQASQMWSIYGEQLHNHYVAQPRGVKQRDLVL